MDAMTLLRTFAAATTIIAAALVAAKWNARVMVAGFAHRRLAGLDGGKQGVNADRKLTPIGVLVTTPAS
jgi:hypothetical protein